MGRTEADVLRLVSALMEHHGVVDADLAAANRPRLGPGLVVDDDGRGGREESVSPLDADAAAVLARAAGVHPEAVAVDDHRRLRLEDLDGVIAAARLGDVHDAVLAVAARMGAEANSVIRRLKPWRVIARIDTEVHDVADVAA